MLIPQEFPVFPFLLKFRRNGQRSLLLWSERSQRSFIQWIILQTSYIWSDLFCSDDRSADCRLLHFEESGFWKNAFQWRNLIVWLAGFIIYRILMHVDTPLGNTLPDMVITVVLCLIVEKVAEAMRKWGRKNEKSNLKKLTVTAILAAVAVVGSLFSFPVFGSKCAPVQHMVNILCAVTVGPWWALAQAFIASLIRNLLGLGSPLAFPGSMCGALLGGLLYKYGKKLPFAYIEK